MSASNYMEDRLLNTLRNVSGAVAAVYIKLHVGDPGETGANNAAVETTRKAVTFAAASGGSMATSADITWTNVAGTEDYTFFSLWDSDTAGNCLWTGTITANSVTAGDTFTIPSGSLTLTAD